MAFLVEATQTALNQLAERRGHLPGDPRSRVRVREQRSLAAGAGAGVEPAAGRGSWGRLPIRAVLWMGPEFGWRCVPGSSWAGAPRAVG